MSVYLSVCLGLCPCVYVCLSAVCYLFVSLSAWLPVYLPVCMSVCPSASVYLGMCLCVYVCLSVYLPVCLLDASLRLPRVNVLAPMSTVGDIDTGSSWFHSAAFISILHEMLGCIIEITQGKLKLDALVKDG
ncbi:hypothetical protein Y032_0508g2713 [Ancylostoma ceylanicum]|uniref:Uncharacterized protein n=1 Tax=Ancylostoma ceylanicum TaxID=53326 RepID=A0A016WTR1_9BILA|nr:hypothetical protein Y032_0508g2713 [Ancylostoma ceylanicum]